MLELSENAIANNNAESHHKKVISASDGSTVRESID